MAIQNHLQGCDSAKAQSAEAVEEGTPATHALAQGAGVVNLRAVQHAEVRD